MGLVIEKEETKYWFHLMVKKDKMKHKHQCRVDWDRFMDEDEAKKSKKGIKVDYDSDYGNLYESEPSDDEMPPVKKTSGTLESKTDEVEMKQHSETEEIDVD